MVHPPGCFLDTPLRSSHDRTQDGRRTQPRNARCPPPCPCWAPTGHQQLARIPLGSFGAGDRSLAHRSRATPARESMPQLHGYAGTNTGRIEGRPGLGSEQAHRGPPWVATRTEPPVEVSPTTMPCTPGRAARPNKDRHVHSSRRQPSPRERLSVQLRPVFAAQGSRRYIC